MAGHSKWANIKFRKAAQDKKRGKLFTKLNKEITSAVKEGGGDPQNNSRLRLAIEKALQGNMTRDTIQKTILKVIKSPSSDTLERIRYEGYGPEGMAILVDCLTDNRNRTAAEVRHAFSKNNGNLGASGSVAYLFKHQGLLIFTDLNDEEQIMEMALNQNAEDCITEAESESIMVSTAAQDYENIKNAYAKVNLHANHSELGWYSDERITISDTKHEQVAKLILHLEDLDDVQEIYHNAIYDES
jgi:YebC/PmpR family DNA-binding regulatory protein